ncbi:MAG: FmdB family zinc ribbon protein [Bryobacteraceae bacterium]
MPLYEYRCQKCDSVFEVMQKFSDEPLTEHAGCGGTVERLLSAPALQFKGTGWYVTDYARSGGGSRSESKSAEKKESKSTSGSDSGGSKSSSPDSPAKS